MVWCKLTDVLQNCYRRILCLMDVSNKREKEGVEKQTAEEGGAVAGIQDADIHYTL